MRALFNNLKNSLQGFAQNKPQGGIIEEKLTVGKTELQNLISMYAISSGGKIKITDTHF